MGFENDTYIGTLKICAYIRIKNVGIYPSLCPTVHIVLTHSCDL